MPRQQMVVERKMYQFNGAMAVQFSQHIGAMHMYRFMTEFEFKGDLFNAVSFDQ